MFVVLSPLMEDVMPKAAADAIDDLLARFPDAEFGPAHVVVSDHNLEDVFVLDCLADCEAMPPSAERDATIEALRTILTVPAADRDAWGEVCMQW